MQGLLLAISAYTLWGFFPLFFDYLSDVLPQEVLSHRIIWSCVTTLIFIIIFKRSDKLISGLTNKKIVLWLVVSALLIALNWLVYIYAIVEHRVLESSLGYFITPVVSLILARVFFKEKIHILQIIAGLIAMIAIIWEVYSLGQLPWISLVLSMAFAFYGVVRKLCPIDGVSGLTIETLILLPFTLLWISYQSYYYPGTLSFGTSENLTALLVCSGIITAVPLVLFAMSARRISLSVVGFIMYINPTMQFLIAIFILDEPYEMERMITFGFIWFALILFMIGFHRLSMDKTIQN